MGTIHVKYDEVFAEVERLRGMSSGVAAKVGADYSRIQSRLSDVDGATSAALVSVMDANRQKAVLALDTLDKLLVFIAGSAKQIKISEQRIASSMTAGKR